MKSVLLSAQNISCYRNEKALFSAISLHLSVGEILQITGCNGSGKTTLLRTLAGIYQNYHGKIERNYRKLFYLSHQLALKKELSVYENLALGCETRDSQAILETLEKINLMKFKNSLCGQLSQGQKQRLALAKFQLSSAELLILDEPAAALDFFGLEQLGKFMYEKVQQQTAIIFTSHQSLAMKNIRLNILELNAPEIPYAKNAAS